MTKLVVIATIRVASGTRDEYLKQLLAHRQRCLAGEPGTLTFEVLVPHKEADAIMLYEVYADQEAFNVHFTGDSMEELKRNTVGMSVSLTGVPCSLAS